MRGVGAEICDYRHGGYTDFIPYSDAHRGFFRYFRRIEEEGPNLEFGIWKVGCKLEVGRRVVPRSENRGVRWKRQKQKHLNVCKSSKQLLEIEKLGRKAIEYD